MKKKIEGIDDEFQELGSMLSNIDFSENTDKDKVYANIIKNIKKEKGKNMLRKKIRNSSIIAASLLLISLVTIKPSWAVNTAKFILNTITFGKIQFNEVSHEKQELPDFYKGKVFDKDGNPVTETDPYDNDEKLYDENGKEIFRMKGDAIVTVDEKDQLILETTNIDEINDYISFDIKIPEYLPEGFKFEKATFEKYRVSDPKGSIKNAALYFKSESTGEELVMDESYIDDEPIAVMGDSHMDKFKLNDVDAVEYKDKCISWVKDGMCYSIGTVDRDLAAKIEDSIK